MSKKVVVATVGMFFFTILCLTGCGGGGGSVGTTNTPTPTGTVISLAAFNSVYFGTAAGAQFSFPALFGSDSQGRAWSGSLTIIADGATTFEGQSVTKQRALNTLQVAGGASISGTSTSYFQAVSGYPYKFIGCDGVTFIPNQSMTLPDSAKVGDSGDLGTYAGTDSTTQYSAWSLSAGFNGGSTLTLSTTTKTGTTPNSVEIDSFQLDATGTPTSFSASLTKNGLTVNLTGSKS